MPRRLTLRSIAAALLAAGATMACAPHAVAQPATTRILVGFAAGGSADSLARYLAERLREPLGRTVIVENRTGAAGRLAVEATRSAAPDGGTLMLVPSGPVTLFPHIFRDLKYDAFRDFTPIALLASQDMCLTTGPATPARTLAELREWLRANPGKASFGSPGAGTIPHFTGVLFGQRAKLDLVHVPYRGSALSANDVAAGQIATMFSPCTDPLELHRAGRVRIVASTDAERSPFLPEVPTLLESGLDVRVTAWFALYGPAKLAPEFVQRASAAALEAVGSAGAREQMRRLGLVPAAGGPDALIRAQQRDFEMWSRIVRDSGFTPEN